MNSTDVLVIGAGAVGLAIARELKLRYPNRSVTVLEKERRPGMHSSGRNSGVLHSGIYYPPDSLKARVCGQGAREMQDFCVARGLPINRIGKILVPVEEGDAPQLELLAQRAAANGIAVERLDEKQLKEVEPEARSATGNALLVRSTSVVNAGKVMDAMVSEVRAMGVNLLTSTSLEAVDTVTQTAILSSGRLAYSFTINAAGLHADRIAHLFGVGQQLTLLPFKGIYWKLDPKAGLKVHHLIYPVPDLRVPFLGVHTTTSTDGITYLGPTAVPAFGRENYRGWQDVRFSELLRICMLLSQQFASGRDGFRRLAWQEGRRYFKPWFADAARALMPRLRARHLLPADKVGIRAQMLDKSTGELVTDFVIERGPASIHILNAISPAFTSAFPFARFVLDKYYTNSELGSSTKPAFENAEPGLAINADHGVSGVENNG